MPSTSTVVCPSAESKSSDGDWISICSSPRDAGALLACCICALEKEDAPRHARIESKTVNAFRMESPIQTGARDSRIGGVYPSWTATRLPRGRIESRAAAASLCSIDSGANRIRDVAHTLCVYCGRQSSIFRRRTASTAWAPSNLSFKSIS